MISLSFLALGCIAFLVVVTVAVMLGLISGKRGEPLGCLASCGALMAMILAGIVGIGIVIALASGGRHHRHAAGPSFERRMERFGERAEDRAERFGERMEDLGERLENRVERTGARIERNWGMSWDF